MSLVDEPITRQEMYLSYLNGNTDITLPEPITRIERYLYALCMNGGGGGGGGEGTNNYNNLSNLPIINGITLKGSKSLDDLGIQEKVKQELFEINIDDDGNLVYTDGYIIKKEDDSNG